MKATLYILFLSLMTEASFAQYQANQGGIASFAFFIKKDTEINFTANNKMRAEVSPCLTDKNLYYLQVNEGRKIEFIKQKIKNGKIGLSENIKFPSDFLGECISIGVTGDENSFLFVSRKDENYVLSMSKKEASGSSVIINLGIAANRFITSPSMTNDRNNLFLVIKDSDVSSVACYRFQHNKFESEDPLPLPKDFVPNGVRLSPNGTKLLVSGIENHQTSLLLYTRNNLQEKFTDCNSVGFFEDKEFGARQASLNDEGQIVYSDNKGTSCWDCNDLYFGTLFSQPVTLSKSGEPVKEKKETSLKIDKLNKKDSGYYQIILSKSLGCNGDLIVRDLDGNRLFSQSVSSALGNELEFNIGRFAAGVYKISVETPCGIYDEKSLVIGVSDLR